MKKNNLSLLVAILTITAPFAVDAADSSGSTTTEVLGYSIGSSTCTEIKRNLAGSHPELVEGKMSDLPKKYKAVTTDSSGYGVIGLTKVSMVCEDSGADILRGASLLFDKGAETTVTDIFEKKYTALQKQGGSALYKTPSGVLMTSSTTEGLKAIYSDMTLFQDLSDMANSMDSKL